MKGDDDPGLMRLRAFGHHHRPSLPSLLSLMPPPPPPPPPPLSSPAAASPPVALPRPEKTVRYSSSTLKKRPTVDASGRAAAGPLLLLGQEIDVNSSEEDARASSPNSALSTASGRTTTTTVGVDNDGRALHWRATSDEEEDCEGARKRLRLSKEQTAVLEQSFKAHSILNPKLKLSLARRLNVTPRQVEVWFQNRRARTKLKQTEGECEFLRRCCDRLAAENKQLQKEVEELRAQQKLLAQPSTRFFMRMISPAALSICPTCDFCIPGDAPGSAAAGRRR